MQMRRRRLFFSEADRNTASPTESVVWKRKEREHSGADQLKIVDGAACGSGRKHAVGWYVVRVKYKEWSYAGGSGCC